MDILTRRQLLITQPNPDASIDYLVSLGGQINRSESKSITIQIYYVPDQVILDETSLSTYLKSIGAEVFPSSEHAGIMVLNDFNNELIPRWLQITLSQPFNIDGYAQIHEIRYQDRQPNWRNSPLLRSFGLR